MRIGKRLGAYKRQRNWKHAPNRISPCTLHLLDHSFFAYWSMWNMSVVKAALLCTGSCRLYCCHTLQRLPKSPPDVPAYVYAFAGVHVIFTYPPAATLPATRRAIRIVIERRYMQSAFLWRVTDALLFPVFYLKVPPLKTTSLMHNVLMARLIPKKHWRCFMSFYYFKCVSVCRNF